MQSGWDTLLPGSHKLVRMWVAPRVCLALSVLDCGVSDGYSRGSPYPARVFPCAAYDSWGPATSPVSLSWPLLP